MTDSTKTPTSSSEPQFDLRGPIAQSVADILNEAYAKEGDDFIITVTQEAMAVFQQEEVAAYLAAYVGQNEVTTPTASKLVYCVDAERISNAELVEGSHLLQGVPDERVLDAALVIENYSIGKNPLADYLKQLATQRGIATYPSARRFVNATYKG